MSKQEKLEKMRRTLAGCKSQSRMNGGRTEADYAFRKRVSSAVDLFLDYMDLMLSEE